MAHFASSLKEGDEVVVVAPYSSGPKVVTVDGVGRKWVYLSSGNRLLRDQEGMYKDADYAACQYTHGSPTMIFRSMESYEENMKFNRLRSWLWKNLSFNDLTDEQAKAIALILGHTE